jgi:hypothetical protein
VRWKLIDGFDFAMSATRSNANSRKGRFSYQELAYFFGVRPFADECDPFVAGLLVSELRA